MQICKPANFFILIINNEIMAPKAIGMSAFAHIFVVNDHLHEPTPN